MEYSIYKFDFTAGVHFGTGMLNESSYTFMADQLFSALYIEALKMERAEEFYKSVKEGRLLFSDSFPYIDQQYMIPKPMIYVETLRRGESKQKKAFKKLKFIPVNQLSAYLNGTMNVIDDPMKGFGCLYQQTMADVRTGEETLPFRVGTFYYSEGCGLYILLAYQATRDREMAEELLESLSYTGIGGKKASGLGKFTLRRTKIPEDYRKYMEKESKQKILLSVALPKDYELDIALEDASYQLIRRSGFVSSITYADEWRKKKDLYVFGAGSCFNHTFEGDIYEVSNRGKHPVYRYAKPIFMGV